MENCQGEYLLDERKVLSLGHKAWKEEFHAERKESRKKKGSKLVELPGRKKKVEGVLSE